MITCGLLWYSDNKNTSFVDKVSLAVARFQQKYGYAPDICYVHPLAMQEHEMNVGLVKVLTARTVLPNHFWLGSGERAVPGGKSERYHTGGGTARS